MVNLIDENENPDVGHVNYQYVAGRQRLSMLRKEVYGKYSVPSLYSIVARNVEIGMYSTELLEWYTKEEWDQMDEFVDHSKDEKYTYSAIEQLYDKYLVRNRVTNKIYETPQVRYIVAAATIFL
jgi:ribonucleoside-diphosphate reductase alpha chain